MNRKEFITNIALAGTAAMMIPALAKANFFGLGPDKKLRLGIIGCGSVSGVYLPHLLDSPYVEHSLHILEIIEAARESQKTGNRIQLVSKFPFPVMK